MGETILTTAIDYEQGYIFYCRKIDGKVAICKAKAGRKKLEQ